MKPAVIATVCFIVLAGAAWGVEIRPTNFTSPSPGGTFSFDFIVTSPPTEAVSSAQLTLSSVSGPGSLTLDSDASIAIQDDPSYWIYGNNIGAGALDKGGGIYQFGDGADDPSSEAIAPGDAIARFAFTWDGTIGDYVFSLDTAIINSFLQLESFNKVELSLPDGMWFTEPVVSATDNSFTVHIPEPATIALLAAGSLVMMRRRRR